MRFGRQTSKFSEIVWKCQMTVPAVVVLVEGRSTGGDREVMWSLSLSHKIYQNNLSMNAFFAFRSYENCFRPGLDSAPDNAEGAYNAPQTL